MRLSASTVSEASQFVVPAMSPETPQAKLSALLAAEATAGIKAGLKLNIARTLTRNNFSFFIFDSFLDSYVILIPHLRAYAQGVRPFMPPGLKQIG